MKTRALLTISLLLSAAAEAQPGPSLQQDPSTGRYTLSYTDESGIGHSVQFFGPDQVAPEWTLSVSDQGLVQYQYTIKNGGSAKQPLFGLDIDCERGSVSPLRRPRLKVWNSPQQSSTPPRSKCSWTLARGTGEQSLGPLPGASFNGFLVLQSTWLPGIREARAQGVTEDVTFTEEGDDDVQELYLSTRKFKVFPVVSPKYLPEVFSDPAKGIAALLDELTQSCSLGWTSPEGICNSLRVKLEHAQAALTAGDRKATARHLDTYASELRAQSGKHVAEGFANAMIFDAGFLLRVLQ